MPLDTLRFETRTHSRCQTPRTAGPGANLECTRCGKRYYSAASRFSRPRPACGNCLGELVHIGNGGRAA
jgi:hypothetical protein